MEVQLENARLWVEDDGDGPPVVFLHGGLGDSRLWEPVVERLRDTFRCIRFDFRFYGRSEAEAVEWSSHDDVVAVLDALGVDHDLAVPAPREIEVLDRRAQLRQHAEWVRTSAAPWVHRRLTGRSSGDGLDPRYPVLSRIG